MVEYAYGGISFCGVHMFKVIVNGKEVGIVENTTELLAIALHYFLYGEEKTTITLEEK